MSLRFATPDKDLTEKEWSRLVYQLADSLGWRRYHPYRSDKSQPGWPDEALVKGDRLLLLELKTEKGRLSDAQHEWLGALARTPAETYVVRPRHLQLLAVALGPPGPARDHACQALAIERDSEIREAAA